MPAPVIRLSSETEEQSISVALETLSKGGVLLFPTESVYGLGVDSQNQQAMNRVYDLKGRPREKPFQWLVPDLHSIREASNLWDERIEKIAEKFWPGPLTLVLPSKAGGTIGWRIPRHNWLLKLLQKLNHPLAATSANLSGQPTLNQFEEVFQIFKNSIDLAFDGGEMGMGIPSTVISIIEGNLQVLREGAIPKQDILKVFKD